MEVLLDWIVPAFLLPCAALIVIWMAGAIYFDICFGARWGRWLAASWVIGVVLLFALWQPIGGTVWALTGEAGFTLVRAIYFTGWGMLLYATALIDHFDLFGLRQAWLGFCGRPYTSHPFKTPGLYRHMRHPLYVSWAIIFWATPVMSVGQAICMKVTSGVNSHIR